MALENLFFYVFVPVLLVFLILRERFLAHIIFHLEAFLLWAIVNDLTSLLQCLAEHPQAYFHS